MKSAKPIQLFLFQEDDGKPGRVLSSVRIGDVYMSRLVIEAGVTTGNYYHKKTKILFYVEKGEVQAAFEHVKTKEKRLMTLRPGKHVVHVPPLVALATKNLSRRPAVLVFFSNRALRSPGDSFPYPIL